MVVIIGAGHYPKTEPFLLALKREAKQVALRIAHAKVWEYIENSIYGTMVSYTIQA